MERFKSILIGIFYAYLLFVFISVFFYYGIHQNHVFLPSYLIMTPYAFTLFFFLAILALFLQLIALPNGYLLVLASIISIFAFFKYVKPIKLKYKIMLISLALATYGLIFTPAMF
jgi:hypothetical protein